MSRNTAGIEQGPAIEEAASSAIIESDEHSAGWPQPDRPAKTPGQAASPAKPVTLVIEVPFVPVRRRGEAARVVGAPVSVREAYLKALAAEVAGADDVLAGRRIASIEVRGSAATCDGLARLIRNLRRSHDVDVRGDFVLEMTPLTAGTPSLTSLNGCRFRALDLRRARHDRAHRVRGAGDRRRPRMPETDGLTARAKGCVPMGQHRRAFEPLDDTDLRYVAHSTARR